MISSIELHFSSSRVLALEASRVHPRGKSERLSVRGKTTGVYADAFTFQWTLAVRALCELFVASALAADGEQAKLVGGAGTSAATLDYAVSKQPLWIVEMFGTDSLGRALIQRLLKRTNPERKRGGDVILSLHSNNISPRCIRIFLDRTELRARDQLATLLREIQSSSVRDRVSAGELELRSLAA